MNLESIRHICLQLPGRITESFPFDETTLVFKVNGKMFLLAITDDHPIQINLKCDPAQAVEWREEFEAVRPGYHMNKKYWNTVTLDNSIPPPKIREMVEHSFDEVVKGFSQTVQTKLIRKMGGRK